MDFIIIIINIVKAATTKVIVNRKIIAILFTKYFVVLRRLVRTFEK